MCCTGQHTHGDTSPTKRQTPHERSSWAPVVTASLRVDGNGTGQCDSGDHDDDPEHDADDVEDREDLADQRAGLEVALSRPLTRLGCDLLLRLNAHVPSDGCTDADEDADDAEDEDGLRLRVLNYTHLTLPTNRE